MIRLDHIGIAVESIDERLEFYKVLGLEVEGFEEVPDQGVRAAFIPVGESSLELLEPTAPDSPIARHLERRGPGIHHICLQVADIHRAMARLVDAGYRLLSKEPRPGAHGHLVCFVHPASTGGVLVELSQPVGEEPR